MNQNDEMKGAVNGFTIRGYMKLTNHSNRPKKYPISINFWVPLTHCQSGMTVKTLKQKQLSRSNFRIVQQKFHFFTSRDRKIPSSNDKIEPRKSGITLPSPYQVFLQMKESKIEENVEFFFLILSILLQNFINQACRKNSMQDYRWLHSSEDPIWIISWKR